LMSAWMPAPPPESEPAMIRILGITEELRSCRARTESRHTPVRSARDERTWFTRP
jgi:hypothetical protein